MRSDPRLHYIPLSMALAILGCSSRNAFTVRRVEDAAVESPTAPRVPSTATRPQLTDVEAMRNTVLQHFELTGDLSMGLTRDPWDPTAGVGEAATFPATFTVDPQGGAYPTVSAAIAAAIERGGSDRVYLRVEPGTYREVVCVPVEAPPITLYGRDADPSRTVIVFDNYQTKPKAVNESANPCNPNLSGTTFGTSGSATFAVYAADFRARDITFANDFDEAGLTMGTQGVALMTAGDRASFENIRVLSNHDTLYPKTLGVGIVARAYFKNSYIEGDEDFIFGRASVVLDHCNIHYLSSRRGVQNSGFGIVPSTDVRNDRGFLVVDSDFTAEAGTPDDSVYLGRAWDESQVDLATYERNMLSGIFPNGKAVIRDSRMGAHIFKAAPWAPSAIVGRPFHSTDDETPANRLYEFNNEGPGRGLP